MSYEIKPFMVGRLAVKESGEKQEPLLGVCVVCGNKVFGDLPFVQRESESHKTCERGPCSLPVPEWARDEATKESDVMGNDLSKTRVYLDLPKWAVPDAQIQRKPYGTKCRVVKVDKAGPCKALVREAVGGCCWISAKTLLEKWQPCEPSALKKLLTEIRYRDDLMPVHLRAFRDAWIAEGCEGLK